MVNNAEMLYKQALASLQQGEIKNALNFLDQALEEDPKYIPAWNNKGVAHLELGELKEALSCFESVIRLNPGDNMAWYNKGYVLQLMNDYTNSKEALEFFLRRHPGKDDFRKYALYLLAKNYNELKDSKKALEKLKESLEIDNSFYEAIELKRTLLKNLKF